MAKTFQVDTGGTLTTSLVSYYKLEDVNDFYASNNLTNNATVAFNAGKVGNAADSGASNTTKYLNIASNMGIDGGNCSISAWVNITTAPSSGLYNYIVSQLAIGSTKCGYSLAYHNDGGTLKVYFIREKSGVVNQGVDIIQTLTIGTWYHLVVTYNGTNVEGWLNGSSQGTSAASGDGTVGSDHFAILAAAYGGTANQTMSGLVDEVGIWSKKLSDQEVADLYNGGSGQTMINETNISVVDTVTVSESISATIDLGDINVNDAVTVAESITMDNSSLGDISVFESVTITESVLLDSPFDISVFDSVATTESLTMDNSSLGDINVNDTVTVAENITMGESDVRRGFIKMRSTGQGWPISMDDNRTL